MRTFQIAKRLAVLFLAFGFLSIMPSGVCSKESDSFVRVNQVGYEVAQEAHAYFMYKGAAEGSKFSVNDGRDATEFSGSVGPTIGNWGSYRVYAINFTIKKEGTYHVSVTGTVTAKSPDFQISTAAKLYAGSLANALSFYQNQRDGEDFIPSDLRKQGSHLNDKIAKVYQTPEFADREGSQIKGNLTATDTSIDASGGWWDAGDYLKFVHTTSYVVAVMMMGLRDFPKQMGPASRAADFTSEAKFGLDWLLRMWDDHSQTLYYQVGIGSRISGAENDHSVWRLPQEDDTSHGSDAKYQYIRNRPVFIAGSAGSKISPNLAGRLAGDFALCFQISYSRKPTYANRCLFAAEHIFDLADTKPEGHLLTTAPYDFYGETQWTDDMEFAATELYLALQIGNLPQGLPHSDPSFYLRAAAEWSLKYIQGKGTASAAFDVADIGGLAHFDLYRVLSAQKTDMKLAVTPAVLLDDMRKGLAHSMEQASKDPFGFGISWGLGDTPAKGFAIAVLASEYGYISKSSEFSVFAKRWMDNTLGANAWGVSFVVGDGTIFPHCIHHQVANLTGSNDGQKPILAGAVVEGPLRKGESGAPQGIVACPPDHTDRFSEFNGNQATYSDDARFYSTNEPALDLTAASILAFSWQIAGEPSSVR